MNRLTSNGVPLLVGTMDFSEGAQREHCIIARYSLMEVKSR